MSTRTRHAGLVLSIWLAGQVGAALIDWRAAVIALAGWVFAGFVRTK